MDDQQLRSAVQRDVLNAATPSDAWSVLPGVHAAAVRARRRRAAIFICSVVGALVLTSGTVLAVRSLVRSEPDLADVDVIVIDAGSTRRADDPTPTTTSDRATTTTLAAAVPQAPDAPTTTSTQTDPISIGTVPSLLVGGSPVTAPPTTFAPATTSGPTTTVAPSTTTPTTVPSDTTPPRDTTPPATTSPPVTTPPATTAPPATTDPPTTTAPPAPVLYASVCGDVLAIVDPFDVEIVDILPVNGYKTSVEDAVTVVTVTFERGSNRCDITITSA